ncbi:MAG: peptidylprolyl isomerase [Acidobacteriota bacterium]
MLPLFRRRKEWVRWVMLVVIIAIGVTTVLLFVRTPSGMRAGLGYREVAKVAGRPITANEYGRYYRQLYETYRRVYNLDKQDPDIVRQLGIEQAALNQLIRQYAAAYAARELGLRVPADELRDNILRVFSDNGQFVGTDTYRRILQANNVTVREFESAMERDLLVEKLRQVLTDGITATPDEIRQAFAEANQQVKVRYVVFDPAAMEEAEVSEETLRKYYEENQDEFREPERRRVTLANIYVKPTDVEVTEADIEAEMGEAKGDEQVHARHILIQIEDDNEEAARKEAEEILRQLRQGADFEKLAREHSDDPGSAAKGGDLGFFGRGQMVPEFERVAFSLKPGEISDLVRTPFGFHIIQTLEKTSPGEAARRAQAEFNARLKKAAARGREIANQIAAAVRQGTPFEDAVKEAGFEVLQTRYFTGAEGVPTAGAGQDFTQQVFNAQKGELVGPYDAAGRYLLARIDDIQEAHVPPFDEIRDRVAEQYRKQEADQLAQDKAQEFFRRATREGQDFETLAKELGLEVTLTDFFRKGVNIDDNLKFSPEVHDQAFTLDPGKVSTPILVAGKYIVFQVAEKTPLDEEALQAQWDTLAEQIAQRKRSEFFNAYVQQVIEELRKKDLILINQELVRDLTS